MSLKVQSRRKKLSNFLKETDDESFCRLIWAVDALQSDRESVAAKVLRGYPADAVNAPLNNGRHLYKWMLETLFNELLTTPKLEMLPGRNRRVDCTQWGAAVSAYNLLHELEDAEDGVGLNATNVLDEVVRIGHRQFAWQRRQDNVIDLYRSLYLFGGPACSAQFQKQVGIEIPMFVLSAFAIMVHLWANSFIAPRQAMPEFGLTEKMFSAALPLLVLDHKAAVTMTTEMRRPRGHISYKPSVLRKFPCVQFADRICAPLPALVFVRATAGLYYDLVGAGGSVTNEFGLRFEEYSRELITATAIPGLAVRPSYAYKANGKSKDSPDLLIDTDLGLSLIGECKAKRMPFGTRFGEAPKSNPEAQVGFEEIAKGVFQIWRFAAHCRAGFTRDKLPDNALGFVLTLDPWMSMAVGRRQDLLARAERMAADEPSIELVDKIPVAFCAIEDFEVALRTASGDSLAAAIKEAADAEFAGWHFQKVHERHQPADTTARGNPFKGRLEELLPWWSVIEAKNAGGRSGKG